MSSNEATRWRVVLADGEHVTKAGAKFKVGDSGALFMLDASGTQVQGVFAPSQWPALWPEKADDAG